MRLTPHVGATLSTSTFLHVTMEVDLLATDRRYPQLLISDQPAPVQETLASGTTLIIQPKGMSPSSLQVQLCDHRNWDVNMQCPRLPMFSSSFASPVRPLSDGVGLDRTMKLDVYLSAQRLYLLVDDAPYSCTALPAVADDGNTYGAPPIGPVTVTFGDVLFASSQDFTVAGQPLTLDSSFQFVRSHLQTVSRRHFDNLGFTSAVAAPEWNEARFPCVSQ